MSATEAEMVQSDAASTAWSRHAVVVLLVDDQLMIGEAVRRALAGEPDIDFHFFNSSTGALAKAREIAPTVILQDIVMPGVNGLDLVRGYRSDPSLARIPIIVLSTHEEPTVKRDAFAAGANDYLVKLPDRIELIARIRYHSLAYRSQIERDEAYRALRDSQEQLLAANRELQRLTNVDGLTGLSNRRYFNEYIEAEWKRALRARAPLSLLMIDVDHFKDYNDTYGHVAGDEVLKKIAGTVADGCRRSTDLAARYGGEEFAAILPLTPAGDLPFIAERLGRSVEALRLPHPASSTGPFVTISIGGATIVPQFSSILAEFIEAADRALYRAKHAGRNRAAFAAA
jgi:two-component system, chemotaxis family, response regulator WspR